MSQLYLLPFPELPYSVYEKKVEEIVRWTYRLDKKVIIAGDLNAKSSWWNSLQTDRRGRHWQSVLNDANWIVCNKGTTPMFTRGGSKSFIDLTLASHDIGAITTNWQVLGEETLSLHAYIYFEVDLKSKSRRQDLNKQSFFNWTSFTDTIGLRLNLIPDTEKKLVRNFNEHYLPRTAKRER